MKKRVLLLALTMALLISCAVFAVGASSETTNTFETNFVCPCGCQKGYDEIEWRVWGDSSLEKPYEWNLSDHYLVSSTLGPGSVGTLTGIGEEGAKKIVVVFHKSDSTAIYFGSTLTSSTGTARTNRTFEIPAGTTAYLVGDNATVWGPAKPSDVGGIVKVEAGAVLNATGIKFRTRTDATNQPTNGGIIYNKGTLSLKDCSVTGIAVSGNGGAIWSSGNTTLENVTVSGGSAVQGGNIYLQGQSGGTTLTIKGTTTIKNGTASVNGGNVALVYSEGAAKLAMSAGTISGGTSNGSGIVSDAEYYKDDFVSYLVDYVQGGGNLFVFRACEANITGGTISDGKAEACGGGNVFVQGTLKVSGTAKLTGGTAIKGGNIYAFDRNPCADSNKDGVADSNPKLYAYVDISGGEVTGGTAAGTADVIALGGTIYAHGGGKNNTGNKTYGTTGLTITGGTVGGGKADGDKGGNGGAIYILNTNATLSGCTINGGTATKKTIDKNTYGGLGGAIYQNKGTLTMGADTVISGGTAYRGGCVYVDSAATFTMNGGTISGGKSTNQGGLGFVLGTFNMTSGVATANTASTSNARGFRVQSGKMNLSGDAKIVSAGKSYGDGIDLLRTGDDVSTGVLTLAGSASVVGPKGELTNNIRVQNYANKSSKLSIAAGWEGQASVWYEYLFGSTYRTGNYAVGMVLDSAFATCTGDYTGTLLMEGAANNPPLYADENNSLRVAYVQLCTYNLPKLDAQWFKSGTEAAAAAKDGDFIDIYAAGTMDIGSKDVLVDFNGFDYTVTGTGKLYIMDSAGDEYGDALAKVTYDNVATNAINPANDYQYIALPNDDGTWSAHRVNVRISAVSVRPSSAGIYYTASINCDDTLQSKFKVAGVAASLEAIPGSDFAETSLYTEVTELKNKKATGVLINEILKEGEDNSQRGNSTVYANAYATFTVAEDTTVTILADNYNGGKTKGNFLPGHVYTAYSLNDAMQAIDLRWRNLDEKAKTNVIDNLYDAYDKVMHNWDLRYINAYLTGEPVKNLKVLTIGNSLSVDAGHMLGYIAKLEGMENVRFSTLYYGGCTLRQHVNFLTANTTEYRWYDTNITDLQNTTDADTKPVVSMSAAKQVTMYDGIVADNWDIIILQQGVFEASNSESHGEDLQTLINYVMKHATNPNVVLMWNMIWAGPVEDEMVDKANNGIPPDSSAYESKYEEVTGYEEIRNNKDAQNKMYAMIREAVQQQIVGNGNILDIIPAGTAQQNALWSGLSDADMYRDYIHASDLSRYIYSYVWYCKLTDSEFDGVASDKIPLAIRYNKKDDQSEVEPATADLDLTENDNYLLKIVNHSISSALSDPFTPKGLSN